MQSYSEEATKSRSKNCCHRGHLLLRRGTDQLRRPSLRPRRANPPGADAEPEPEEQAVQLCGAGAFRGGHLKPVLSPAGIASWQWQWQ